MKKSFVLIAAILAVVGLATAVAVANETTKVETTSVHDPRGDTRCFHDSAGGPPKPCSAASKRDADIVRATAGHEGGRLRHTIRVVGEFRRGWLYINTDSDPDCERELILHPGGHAEVRDCAGGPAGSYHGRARVDHHLHSVEIFFRKRQLGNPDGYGWNAFTNVYTGTGTWAAHPSDIVRKWGRYIHQPLG